jgi:hypothetical protein
MTIEERARRLHSVLDYLNNSTDDDSARKQRATIESYLRDQIEDCARILDVAADTAMKLGNFPEAQQHRNYARIIRALAAPEEEKGE